MTLPSALSRTLSETEGGAVIVTGAGCSVPEPTGLPTGAQLSLTVHANLLRHDELDNGDVDDPEDLTAVANAIENKHGSLSRLRDYLPIDELRNARPNEGYHIAIALLLDRVISYVVTLNYDFALNAAVRQLVSRPGEVKVITGMRDHSRLEDRSVIYLHGHAYQEPEEWVVTESELAATGNTTDEPDKVRWRRIIGDRVFSSPVTIFAGLGTRVGVIEDSCRHITDTLSNTTNIYQVDTGDRADSPYADVLGIDEDDFLSLDWIDFMQKIADHVLEDQLNDIREALEPDMDSEGNYCHYSIDDVLGPLTHLGLVRFGLERGAWLLADGYGAWNEWMPDWIADLLLFATIMRSELGSQCHLQNGGVGVLSEDETEVVKSVSLVHGAGQRWVKVESRLLHRESGPYWGERPRTVIVFGVSDDVSGEEDSSEDLPLDVAGRQVKDTDNIVEGPSLEILDGNELMRHPERISSI